MTTLEAVALLERYSNYDGMGIPNLAGCKEAMRVAVDALKEAFPELAESEDERIRKMLIEKVEEWHEKALENNMVEDIKDSADIITYLEKQKEQKQPLSERFRPDFPAVADFIESVDNMEKNRAIGILEDYLKWAVSSEEECRYTWKELADAIQLGIDAMKEQKPAEWSEEDEKNRRSLNTKEIKVGDTITYFRNGKKGIMLVSSFDSGIYPRCKWGITVIDGTAYGDWTPGSGPYYAATEKEKQQLYDTMPIEVKNWLKSLPERFNLQPKQEWSGEDRDILLQTAAILKANFDSDEKFEDCDYDCETLAGKLLEMRYRISPSWKPSEEQMKALERASTNKYLSAEQCDILVSLYQDLKKL